MINTSEENQKLFLGESTPNSFKRSLRANGVSARRETLQIVLGNVVVLLNFLILKSDSVYNTHNILKPWYSLQPIVVGE